MINMKEENEKCSKNNNEELNDDLPIDDEIVYDEDIEGDMIIDDEDDEEDEMLPNDKIDDYDFEEKILSKHKLNNKHSLKHDNIFKGRKELLTEENDDSNVMHFNDNLTYEVTSYAHYESISNETYISDKQLKEKVYNVLLNHTDINFLNNRRKPSKIDFNKYYSVLKKHTKEDNYTNTALFNELAFYFSDNLYNMFKLLDNKWKNLIVSELQDHIGRLDENANKELTPRNIKLNTEIEFKYIEPTTESVKMITGVIVQRISDTEFKVDSYERIYDIKFNDISKILDNTKYRYNLNKLNNIDFL